MSTPKNIEVFNIIAAKALIHLYEKFPVPANIDPKAMLIGTTFEGNFDESPTQHQNLAITAKETVQFLIDEGLIRKTASPSSLSVIGFQNLVLTRDGLSVLQKTPASINGEADQSNYFAKLKAWSATGAKVAASESLGAILGHILANV